MPLFARAPTACRTHLAQHVDALPLVYYVGSSCTPGDKGLGWLHNFMHVINTTFPHPDHILINNGVPGACFSTFAHGTCLESLLPKQPDLVIMEHLPYLETVSIYNLITPFFGANSPEANVMQLEQLINRMQLNFNLSSFPAMLFLNMHLAVHVRPEHASFTDDTKAIECIRNVTLCDSQCPANFIGLPASGSNATAGEVSTNRVAQHYGATALSYTNLVQALLKSPARGKLTECQVFSAIFMDAVHPSPTGHVLMTDLLINYVAGAQQYFRSGGGQQQQQASAAAGSVLSSGRRRVAPLDPRSLVVPQMRCFGTLIQSVVPLFGPDGAMVADELAASSDINVVKAEGWAHVEVEGGKLKPGWVSTAPGSLLWMAVDMDFGHPSDPHFITLTFLTSHEHMGQAAVTCVSGCNCSRGMIDGHISTHKHSIPKIHDFRVRALGSRSSTATTTTDSISSRQGSNAPAPCVVQLEVLPDTGSGEHKVKLIQLAIKTWANVSASSPS